MSESDKMVKKEEYTNFINLENYRELQGFLKHTPENIPKETLIVKLEIPEILMETMKLISALNGYSLDEFMQLELVGSIVSSIEYFLGPTECFKSLYKLAQKQHSALETEWS